MILSTKTPPGNPITDYQQKKKRKKKKRKEKEKKFKAFLQAFTRNFSWISLSCIICKILQNIADHALIRSY